MNTGERRRYPRLAMRLPVTHRPAGQIGGNLSGDFTTNVAAGGVYFVTACPQWRCGQKLDIELDVPPGEGHFPYAGRCRGLATVVRCEPVSSDCRGRWGVAARFDETPNLDFQ
ncbi:MAG: PilZ domain-containing protein [Planctomycetes bacterium]|nr:PilZ domain-containing protein [Planctomycetota bacterium]